MSRLRPHPALVAALALAVVLSACGDTSVEPRSGQTRGPSLPTVATPVQLTEGTLESSSETRFTFVVSPSGTQYSDGVNSIVFPANAICASGSGYGPTYWNAPCSPIGKNVQFTVTLSQVNGRRTATFTPDVRFVPGREVVLTMDAAALKGSSTTPTIFWSPDGSTLVDEGATDASLATVLDSATGTLTRRLKHFSGYTVDLGYKAKCEQDPSLPECTTGGN
jgi:hypothetical protein